MIVKHEFSNAIMTPKREHFFLFFTQTKNCIEKCKETLDILADAINGELDEDEELDALDCQKLNDYSGIQDFARGSFSAKPAMYVCARNTLLHIQSYNDIIDNYVTMGIYLNDEERNALKTLCTKIISELAYMFWFEFDIDEHIAQLELGNDYVDEIVNMYCDTYSLDKKNIIQFAKDTRTAFPFHLSIFDDYPEYEADFERLIGPDIGLLNGKDISIDKIKAVIDGSLPVEDFIDEILSLDVSADNAKAEMQAMENF